MEQNSDLDNSLESHCDSLTLQMKPKLFKIPLSTSSESLFRIARYGDKMKSMPLICKKIEYRDGLKQVCKVPVKGYKYISRVAASGEYTIEILNKIKKISRLKFIQSLEFDPYLCESTGLKALSEVLMKLKRSLDRLHLVFRRFVRKDELKNFSFCLARLDHMRKIKTEFPHTKGIETQDLRYLQRNCRKFVSLKSAEVKLIGSKNFGKSFSRISEIFKNAINIEEAKSSVYLSHKETPPPESLKNSFPIKRFFKNLKSFSLKYAFKTDWSSYFDGADPIQGLQISLQRIPTFINPIHFSLILDKMFINPDIIDALAKMLPQLTNLRFVFIELNNIKLSEFEMMILAKGFADCRHIEHLTFKYMDNTIIPMMDLMPFIIIMAKYSPFPKLDLFFRKLHSSEWQSPEAEKKLDELETINYTLTKQSIHIQKVVVV